MINFLTIPTHALAISLAAFYFSSIFSILEASNVPLTNLHFVDSDGDQIPDNWTAYPGGEGLKTVEEGGVCIKDSSASAGLGIGQWIPVSEGMRYTLSLDLKGTGGLFGYMIFTSNKPAKASQLSQVTLKEKRRWAKGGGDQAMTTSFSEVAPAGSNYAWVWIYSPSSGMTDVTAVKVDLTAEPIAAPVRTPASTYSQVSSDELLKNADFKILDTDGLPIDWEIYPDANDLGTKVSMTETGIHLVDTDKKKGVGLSQWVPVEAGRRYIATADVDGEQGLFLYLIYADRKPQRWSDYSTVKISEKRDWAKQGKQAKVATVAPENASWARVWLYSGVSGKCDVVAREISLRPADTDASRAAVDAGLFGWMDFETGDFSQASSREGAKRELVKKGGGPVREGDFAYKAMLVHPKERTELIGPRSPAYGIARYGWSIYVPEDFDADTFFSIITQWHDWGSGREYPEDGGAPTHLYISKGDWRFKLRFQGEGHTTASEQFALGSIDADRGRWTDWVMEVNWQAPNMDGWLKLYKNDELVIDYKGPTWYEGKDKGPYFKFGIYKGYGGWPGDEQGAQLVFDSFRMALGQDSTYEQVAPSAYSPRIN